jgi:Rrf2 family cysteine metabolism transcriptional repressor
MALLSRKIDYALLLLVELMNREDGASARELADRFQLSRPFIANILKELCQGGLVESTRGVHGGYRLAADPREVTIHSLIRLLEGDLQLVACSGEHPEAECGLLEVCPVRRPLRRLHEKMMGLLSELTLAELASDEPSLVRLEMGVVNA